MRDLQRQPFYDVIKEYDNWVVLFRKKQITIGSMIIMCKNTAYTSLGDLPTEIWAEYGRVCKDVELWLKKAFGAEKFNYLALMMKDPEVHFHVIPRYSSPIRFNNETFVDSDWPAKTELRPLEVSSELLAAIYQKILEVSDES